MRPLTANLILSLVLLSPAARAATPKLSFTAEPTTIALGASTTLRWTSSGATACTASGAWSGSQATTGSRVSKPTAGTKTYTLTQKSPSKATFCISMLLKNIMNIFSSVLLLQVR
ncbi:MAG: hypothetical protein Q8M37_09585 [Nevskia sp.]|nr:hypothetical protein [Nevskia sp.]